MCYTEPLTEGDRKNKRSSTSALDVGGPSLKFHEPDASVWNVDMAPDVALECRHGPDEEWESVQAPGPGEKLVVGVGEIRAVRAK